MTLPSCSDDRAAYKLVVLIQAHAEVEQLNRLIRRLAHPDITIYVNVDLKSDLLLARIDSRACLIRQRTSVHWSEFSFVEATLQGLREILDAEQDFDHVTLISGQDYPVRRPEEMLARLARHRGQQFLAHCPVIDGTHFADRYGLFHYWHGSDVPRVGYKYLRSVMKRLRLRRRMIGGLRAFHGSCWFTLTPDCAMHLLERARDPELMRFMRSTRYPDEHFFHTVLCNSPFAGRIINNDLRFIEFDDGEPHPNILTDAHLHRVLDSDALFCRKIDKQKSALLMRLLDLHYPYRLREMLAARG